jgi:glutaredoxin
MPSAPAPRVTLYTAAGCHLCDRARTTVDAVAAELGVSFDEVDITGDPELEARYRAFLPVLELDGRKAFSYHVPAAALRAALVAQTPGSDTSL